MRDCTRCKTVVDATERAIKSLGPSKEETEWKRNTHKEWPKAKREEFEGKNFVQEEEEKEKERKGSQRKLG